MKEPNLTDLDILAELPNEATPPNQWRSAADVADVFGDSKGSMKAKFRRYENYGWIKQKNSNYALSSKGLAALRAAHR